MRSFQRSALFFIYWRLNSSPSLVLLPGCSSLCGALYAYAGEHCLLALTQPCDSLVAVRVRQYASSGMCCILKGSITLYAQSRSAEYTPFIIVISKIIFIGSQKICVN